MRQPSLTSRRAALGVTPVDAFVGRRVRLRRESLGITVSELARIIGISDDTQRAFENGTQQMSAAMLLCMAGHLESPLLWFYDGAAIEMDTANDPEPNAKSAHDAITSREGLDLLTFYYEQLDQSNQKVLIDLGRVLTLHAGHRGG